MLVAKIRKKPQKNDKPRGFGDANFRKKNAKNRKRVEGFEDERGERRRAPGSFYPELGVIYRD